MYNVPTSGYTVQPRWWIAGVWYGVRVIGGIIATWILRGLIALVGKNYGVLGFSNDMRLFAEYAGLLLIALLPLTLAEWWLLRRWMRSLPWWIIVGLLGRIGLNIANVFFGVQMQSVGSGSFSLPSVIMLSVVPTVLLNVLFGVMQALVLWRVTKRPQRWIWATLVGAIVTQFGMIIMLQRQADAGFMQIMLDFLIRLIQALPALFTGVILVRIVQEWQRARLEVRDWRR